MAGETRGQLAEAIAAVALEQAVMRLGRPEHIFWEESPADTVIKPDLTTGEHKDSPTNLLLVNASDSPKESEKKYWRNIGEIFDAKSRLAPAPVIVNLVFKSEIKPELIRLTARLCDQTHLVDRDPNHGADITRWLETHHAEAPSEKAGKDNLVRQAVNPYSNRYDARFASALDHLAITLTTKLYNDRSELIPLWGLMRTDFLARQAQPARPARVTLLRRGLARWLVFDDDVRGTIMRAHLSSKAVPRNAVPDYALLLGMLEMHINGGYISGSIGSQTDMLATTAIDLRLAAEFFKEAAHGDPDAAAQALDTTLRDVPEEMRRAAELLRIMPQRVQAWQAYVVSNWTKLTTPEGCYEALMTCRNDPTMGGAVGSQDERRVWLYDHLVAILRANSGVNNDFGYGRLMSYFKAASREGLLDDYLYAIVNSLDAARQKRSARWISRVLRASVMTGERGFLEWLKGEKDICEASVACYAYSIANLLTRVEDPQALSLSDLTRRHAYNLWNKLLTHQDFEPLPMLIATACGDTATRVSARTIMADLAEQAVQDAGKMPAFAFEGGLIHWKSVTGAGKDHKRKELSGRARALRFQKTLHGFVNRALRLILVVDGTFNDTDLRVLQESGWDEIYYPDELDKLAASIGAK